ncbi:MAG: RNA polymerase sigma-70 factor [Bacteroidetes bacterium]|nr:RNA polymerase sigma-70 factor [Bacteroidota bacterium]
MQENDQMQNLLNGDDKEFSRIYRKYYSKMYGFALSYVRDPFTAGNMVHDAFIALWENRTRLTEDTNLPAYLLTIVKNNALNHLNRIKTQLRVENDIQRHYLRELDLRCSTLDACNPGNLFSADVEEIIRKTIDSLPEQCRKVIILSRIHGYSNKDIAKRLNISVKGVEFHITRALKSLKGGLKDYITFLFWIFFLLIHNFFNNHTRVLLFSFVIT